MTFLKQIAVNFTKTELVILSLFSIWLFGGCIHQVGYPWNCVQAKEAVRKAQSDYNANYDRQLAKVYVDKETINSTHLKQFALSQAEGKEQELCHN